MSHSSVITSLIDVQVFTGKKQKPETREELKFSKTVRVIYYSTGGLKAVVEDHEGNLEQVNVVEMRIYKK